MERMRVSVLALAFAALAVTGCSVKNNDADPTATPPDVAAPPSDALRTPSGLASKVLRVGLGNTHPTGASTVTVQYSGWTPDGQLFDSSYLARDASGNKIVTPEGRPATFPLTRVIPGWTEGVQLMVAGEKRRFWIPGDLAYDKIDMPGAPKGMLVFDIELLRIQ